ncbi:MAG TPA: hypothetical protein VFQ35_28135, partial [Polyangiaceae bacterium]|nr:hypothetical protein [Polyangiaceae bacterium]
MRSLASMTSSGPWNVLKPSRWPRAAVGPALALALSSLASGCNHQKAAELPAGPATARNSDRSGRQNVSVTIYNSNFGLVRET